MQWKPAQIEKKHEEN